MTEYKNGTNICYIGMVQKNIAKQNVFFGRETEVKKLSKCSFILNQYSSFCILTLDTGYHSSGWWKNPDYETCWHLSISFFDSETANYIPFKQKTAEKIVKQVFGDASSLSWIEPPYSSEGKMSDTWHYRIFIDLKTLCPLLPKGEVYSRELTEKNWLSFSEVCEKKAKETRRKSNEK